MSPSASFASRRELFRKAGGPGFVNRMAAMANKDGMFTPTGLAWRFGPDLLMSGMYAASLPGTVDAGTRAGMFAEDFIDQSVAGVGASAGLMALSMAHPKLRALRALAPVADMAGSLAGSFFGPRPFASRLANDEKTKEEMERQRREKEIYMQGLNASQLAPDMYSPEHGIFNAVVPGY